MGNCRGKFQWRARDKYSHEEVEEWKGERRGKDGSSNNSGNVYVQGFTKMNSLSESWTLRMVVMMQDKLDWNGIGWKGTRTIWVEQG